MNEHNRIHLVRSTRIEERIESEPIETSPADNGRNSEQHDPEDLEFWRYAKGD